MSDPPAQTPAKPTAATRQSRRAHFDVQLDRHEGKYIIHPNLVPEIRRFIAPFCEPDPNGRGDPPEYDITTIQLDSPSLALHYAKENEAISRFKLRVRTYGKPGTNPVFLEVKRKVRGTIMKSRTSIPFDAWGEDLMFDPHLRLTFKSSKEELGFLEFVRLVREIGAEPVVLIRYTRESYFSRNDRYARVSFDRKLLYQPTRSWTNWGEGRHWYVMDSALAQNKQYKFSGIIMELKTLSDTPHWMIDLVQHFDLARTGNCKYSTALWQESLFRGKPALAPYAADVLLKF
ncbi:MAG: polyphosphate polymerase domain-containing protein [Verrucomicrobia bacterium]|nr:polyphosphate polymerase domain-containing protein [Verrucomicrobiota bacterium]